MLFGKNRDSEIGKGCKLPCAVSSIDFFFFFGGGGSGGGEACSPSPPSHSDATDSCNVIFVQCMLRCMYVFYVIHSSVEPLFTPVVLNVQKLMRYLWLLLKGLVQHQIPYIAI